MDAQTELEQEGTTSDRLGQADPGFASADTELRARDEAGRLEHAPKLAVSRPAIEEASFLVLESGRVSFFVRPRVEIEVPTSLEDVQRFSFTLTPRNRDLQRRISLGKKRLPDPHVRERQWAHVDRVASAAQIGSDLGPRRYTTKTRGLRNQSGVIEVACGTYALASHRDHAHLLYELELDSDAVSEGLLRQLRIVPRASYVAAVLNPESKWRVRDREETEDAPLSATSFERGGFDKSSQRRFTPLDPVFLDHEGTELVLVGGGQSRADQMATWARS
ncbi:MAG TPA: hypothetical protein VM925_05810 [Labilithrix sp.]|nr:hypothetical protein [Labilithrix sp.]